MDHFVLRHLSQQAASLRRADVELEGKAVEELAPGERAPPPIVGSGNAAEAMAEQRVRVLAETRDGAVRRLNNASRPVQSAPAQRLSTAAGAGGGGVGNPRPPPTFAVPRLCLPVFHAGASGSGAAGGGSGGSGGGGGGGGGSNSGEHIGCLTSDEVAAFAALAGLPAAVVEVFEADAVDGEVVAAMMNGASNADELRECVFAFASVRRCVLVVHHHHHHHHRRRLPCRSLLPVAHMHACVHAGTLPSSRAPASLSSHFVHTHTRKHTHAHDNTNTQTNADTH
jgi:hypothetical protein